MRSYSLILRVGFALFFCIGFLSRITEQQVRGRPILNLLYHFHLFHKHSIIYLTLHYILDKVGFFSLLIYWTGLNSLFMQGFVQASLISFTRHKKLLSCNRVLKLNRHIYILFCCMFVFVFA